MLTQNVVPKCRGFTKGKTLLSYRVPGCVPIAVWSKKTVSHIQTHAGMSDLPTEREYKVTAINIKKEDVEDPVKARGPLDQPWVDPPKSITCFDSIIFFLVYQNPSSFHLLQ